MTAYKGQPCEHPWSPGLRLNVGVSGSGKTYAVQCDVYEAGTRIPVIVLDRMREWYQGNAGLNGTVADMLPHINGPGVYIVRPPLPITPPGWAEAQALAACEWALRYPSTAGVAIPEAHRVAPNGGRLPVAIEEVACAWRHHDVAMWLDTQRLAKLHKDVTEQATASSLRVFAILGERDLETARDLPGGRRLETCLRDAAVKLGAGEKGWHVHIRPGIVEPVLERFEGRHA